MKSATPILDSLELMNIHYRWGSWKEDVDIETMLNWIDLKEDYEFNSNFMERRIRIVCNIVNGKKVYAEIVRSDVEGWTLEQLKQEIVLMKL